MINEALIIREQDHFDVGITMIIKGIKQSIFKLNIDQIFCLIPILKSANLSGFVDNQPDVKINRVKPERFYLYKYQLIKEVGCRF